MILASVDEARAMMLAQIEPLAAEKISCPDANGRLLREEVIAERDQPPFSVSAMDGWAVRQADIPGTLQVVGESAAGHGWSGTLGRGETVRISTGAFIPDGADWVVIQEEVVRKGDQVTIGATGESSFIRPRGGDFARGTSLLSAGTRLDPWRIALAASAGHAMVEVSIRPRVAIVATGDELAVAGSAPGEWQIHDSVGPGLAAWFGARGCDATLLEAVPDDHGAVSASVQRVDCDLLVMTGGASVGDHDLVKPALRDLGLEMIVDGVAVRPGKPTWFGRLGKGGWVLGLPGNPVSAMVCAELFAAPIIAALEGAAPIDLMRRARLGKALSANGPREHYMRATIRHDELGGLIAEAATDQDSSLLSVLSSAGGLIRRLPNASPAAAGDAVEILPLDRASS